MHAVSYPGDRHDCVFQCIKVTVHQSNHFVDVGKFMGVERSDGTEHNLICVVARAKVVAVNAALVRIANNPPKKHPST